jgi:hypothetical protein
MAYQTRGFRSFHFSAFLILRRILINAEFKEAENRIEFRRLRSMSVRGMISAAPCRPRLFPSSPEWEKVKGRTGKPY